MTRELFHALQRLHIKDSLFRRLKNRRFLKDAGLLMTANVIVIGLGLIRTPAMTWLLPKDEVGMIAVVGSWLPFLQLLSFTGLDSAAYHYTAKGQPWAFIINLKYRLRWSLLSSAGFLLGAIYWWYWRQDASLAAMFLVAGISYPVTIGLSACSGILGAQEKYVGLFWYRIFESLTDFAGFIPLVFSVWWGTRVLTFYGLNQVATAIMMIAVSAILVGQLHRSNEPPLSQKDKDEMLHYGKHLTAMNAIGVAQTRTDSLLVGALLPLAIMADYSIAILVFEQLRRLWNIYYTVRYPRLVRLPLDRKQRRFAIEGMAIWGFFGVAGIGLAIFSHLFIPLLLPASYKSSIPYIDWLILAFVLSVPGLMSDMYYFMQENKPRLYLMRGASAAVSILFPTVLIISLGIQGVLIGRVLSGGVRSGLGIVLFWRDATGKEERPLSPTNTNQQVIETDNKNDHE